MPGIRKLKRPPKDRIAEIETPGDDKRLVTLAGKDGIEIVEVIKKNKGGRPKKYLADYGDKAISEMMGMARLGMSHKSISGALNINFTKYLQLREENPDWARAMDGQRELFVKDNLEKLKRHATTSPQSAQWLLERVKPEEFSAKTELRVSGGVSSSLTFDLSSDLCSRLADARRANTTTIVAGMALDESDSVSLVPQKNQTLLENPANEEVTQNSPEAP